VWRGEGRTVTSRKEARIGTALLSDMIHDNNSSIHFGFERIGHNCRLAFVGCASSSLSWLHSPMP
jgi:hypothetical protein